MIGSFLVPVFGMIFIILLLESSVDSFMSPSPTPAPGNVIPVNEFNVMDYGAWGNGTGDDARAFVNAWKEACWRENATMLVPRGKTFLVSPIILAGPCRTNFKLKIDGILLASQEAHKWTRLFSWITIVRVGDFRVEGAGILDGQGDVWWSRSCKRNPSYPCEGHPTALTLRNCTNVVVQDLKLVNSPQMHLSLQQCSNVIVRGLEIVAPQDSPNTDGIHTHLSRNISIEKCIVETGDDCISIGTNCSDIRVRGVICGLGHGISIGSLGRNKATEYVSNVKVEDSILMNTKFGLRVKTWQGGQGYASNLSYINVMMLNVSHPIIIDQYYCDGNSSFTCGMQEIDAVKVTNISYYNIMGTSATNVALRFQCSMNRPCNNVVLENVFLHLSNGLMPSSFCMNAFGQYKGFVIPNSCLL